MMMTLLTPIAVLFLIELFNVVRRNRRNRTAVRNPQLRGYARTLH